MCDYHFLIFRVVSIDWPLLHYSTAFSVSAVNAVTVSANKIGRVNTPLVSITTDPSVLTDIFELLLQCHAVVRVALPTHEGVSVLRPVPHKVLHEHLHGRPVSGQDGTRQRGSRGRPCHGKQNICSLVMMV